MSCSEYFWGTLFDESVTLQPTNPLTAITRAQDKYIWIVVQPETN